MKHNHHIDITLGVRNVTGQSVWGMLRTCSRLRFILIFPPVLKGDGSVGSFTELSSLGLKVTDRLEIEITADSAP